MKQLEVYLEIGEKRTLAVALEWPGWCRSGRDEATALQTLYDYGPRYEAILQSAALGFRHPSDISELVVVERLTGTATTDFGAPDLALERDSAPVGEAEVQRWEAVLHACWRAFDSAVEAARGRTLAKGPRGGGRELARIVEHVRDAERSYLSSLGGKVELDKGLEPGEALAQIREAILTTLRAAARGEVPAQGPRGGQRWNPRYFVRRLAWHELDHVWEIEDRARISP